MHGPWSRGPGPRNHAAVVLWSPQCGAMVPMLRGPMSGRVLPSADPPAGGLSPPLSPSLLRSRAVAVRAVAVREGFQQTSAVVHDLQLAVRAFPLRFGRDTFPARARWFRPASSFLSRSRPPAASSSFPRRPPPLGSAHNSVPDFRQPLSTRRHSGNAYSRLPSFAPPRSLLPRTHEYVVEGTPILTPILMTLTGSSSRPAGGPIARSRARRAFTVAD